jgi:hypothetical protein
MTATADLSCARASNFLACNAAPELRLHTPLRRPAPNLQASVPVNAIGSLHLDVSAFAREHHVLAAVAVGTQIEVAGDERGLWSNIIAVGYSTCRDNPLIVTSSRRLVAARLITADIRVDTVFQIGPSCRRK